MPATMTRGATTVPAMGTPEWGSWPELNYTGVRRRKTSCDTGGSLRPNAQRVEMRNPLLLRREAAEYSSCEAISGLTETGYPSPGYAPGGQSGGPGGIQPTNGSLPRRRSPARHRTRFTAEAGVSR